MRYLKPQKLPRLGIAAICGSREHTVSNFWQIPRFIISWMPTALGGGQQINRINSVCIVSGAIKPPPLPLALLTSPVTECFQNITWHRGVQGSTLFSCFRSDVETVLTTVSRCSDTRLLMIPRSLGLTGPFRGPSLLSFEPFHKTQWSLLKAIFFLRLNLTCTLFKVAVRTVE